ncbi:MAG TPA: hypothetical protein VK994_04260 [Bacteroidales bacterium]|nr:hypothetical protein [Bacteroidales bacterium]
MKLSKDSKIRIETMVRTNDGFEIAEVDLKLRGPGDIEGTQQSGIPFDMKIASLAKDQPILEHARRVADEILEDDPSLEKDQNQLLKKQLLNISASSKDWSVIS